MVYIYILQLEKGKYYVGKTNNPTIRINNHFDFKGSEWTKIYKPIKILDIIPNCDDYDEDKITKQYMDKYGINNVRGGSFVSIKLKKSIIETLQQMNKGTNNKCFSCGKYGHFANNCNENEYIESDNDTDDTDDIWECEYCDKEFFEEEKWINHENNCIKKENNNYCFRCGREGHYSSSCYATKHINGYYLR